VKHLNGTAKNLLMSLLQDHKVTVQSNKHSIMDNWLNLTNFRNSILDQTDQINLLMEQKMFQRFHLMRLTVSHLLSSLENTILLQTQLMLLLSMPWSKMEFGTKNMILWITSVSWLEKKPLSPVTFLNKSQLLLHLRKRSKNYQWTTHLLRNLPLTYI
jgi:hypothetical protein